MGNRSLQATVFFLALGALHNAQALSVGDVKINGFGTLAAVKTDNSSVDYINAGDNGNFDTDSIAGLQLYYPLHERFSLTGQFLAQGKEHYGFNSDTAWLYGDFSVTDNVDVRAGRLRIPFFMLSDSLEVGYSYYWIRPPTDVYGQLGFTNFDGADALIKIPVGNSGLLVQPYFGSTNPTQDFQGDAGELSVSNLLGVNLQLDTRWITYRIGHTEGDFDINNVASLDGFLSGLNMMGFPNVADKFGIKNRHGKFSEIGINVDYENILVMSEYTQRKTDGLIPDTTAWYTSFGYRMGNFTPNVTYSELKTDENYDAVNAQIPFMPPMLAGGSAQFVQMNTSNNRSLTLGLRWDLLPKTALKFEWQKIAVDAGAYPLNPVFAVNPAGYRSGDDVELFTVAVDFIF
jgi:hypothetical protein